jgi:hypothetical protein
VRIIENPEPGVTVRVEDMGDDDQVEFYGVYVKAMVDRLLDKHGIDEDQDFDVRISVRPA